MAISSDQVWAKFYKELVKLAVPTFDKNLQAVSLAGTTLSADVINADPEISNANIYNIGNMLPSASPDYAPGGDLITSYSLFLQNIDLGGSGDPAVKSKINIAAGNLTAAQKNFTKVQGDAFTQFKAYKDATGFTGDLDTWANTNYPVYPTAKTTLTGAISNYQALMVKEYGAGYSQVQNAQNAVSANSGATNLLAKNPYNMAVKVGSVAPAGAVTVLPGEDAPEAASTLSSTFRPAFAINGGLPAAFSSWQSASASDSFPQTISLSGSFSDADSRDFGWSASAEASYRSWFSVKAKGEASYDSITSNWNESSFDCEVSFNGLQSFPINPDANWFKSGLIDNFKDQLLASSPQFFGEGGSLNAIPASVILAYGLKVKITVDNASYKSFKSSFEQSATVSVGVGPFSFGGTESSHLDTSNFTFTDSSNSIEINPAPTGTPLLLGVVSNKY